MRPTTTTAIDAVARETAAPARKQRLEVRTSFDEDHRNLAEAVGSTRPFAEPGLSWFEPGKWCL